MTSFQYSFRADTALQFEVGRRIGASNWSIWRLLLIWAISFLGAAVISITFVVGGQLLADVVYLAEELGWLAWSIDTFSPLVGIILAGLFWIRFCPPLARRLSQHAYMDAADVVFECSPEGLHWQTGATEMKVGWRDVRAVVEAKSAVIFNLGLLGLYVPKTVFESREHMAAFAAACREMKEVAA